MSNKLRAALLALLVAALVGVALALTGKHGWLAFIVFFVGIYLLVEIRSIWRRTSPRP